MVVMVIRSTNPVLVVSGDDDCFRINGRLVCD